MKCQAEWSTSWIQIAGRNINKLRYADNTTLMAESEEELKSLLMKVKKESEKVGFKLSIQKTKIMASGPILHHRWENNGNSERLYFSRAPKSLQMVTEARKLKDTCSLGKKSLTNLSSVRFSLSVVSDSLRPHRLQHTKPSCPSSTPRVYSDSCPLSRWCHPTIPSSVISFSSHLQSFFFFNIFIYFLI